MMNKDHLQSTVEKDKDVAERARHDVESARDAYDLSV